MTPKEIAQELKEFFPALIGFVIDERYYDANGNEVGDGAMLIELPEEFKELPFEEVEFFPAEVSRVITPKYLVINNPLGIRMYPISKVKLLFSMGRLIRIQEAYNKALKKVLKKTGRSKS